MVEYVRKNFASLSDDDIDEGTLIVSTARGSYPWLNTEVAMVIVDEDELTPSEELFEDFQEAKKQFIAEGMTNKDAHVKAWISVDYEARFLEDLPELEDLPDYSEYKKVIFSCWCATKSPCHTDILVDYYNEEDMSQTTLFQSFEIEDEVEDEPVAHHVPINPFTCFIGKAPGVTSVHNPNHSDFIPIEACKPDSTDLYGGLISFDASLSYGGVNPKTLGRVDTDGNYIKCTPKDLGLKKNKEAKSKPTAYLAYQEKLVADSEVIESFIGNHKSHPVSDRYLVSEWGLYEIKKSYKTGNTINTRWKSFTKNTASERVVLKKGRGESL